MIWVTKNEQPAACFASRRRCSPRPSVCRPRAPRSPLQSVLRTRADRAENVPVALAKSMQHCDRDVDFDPPSAPPYSRTRLSKVGLRAGQPSPDPFAQPPPARQMPNRPSTNRGRRFSDQSCPRYEGKAPLRRLSCKVRDSSLGGAFLLNLGCQALAAGGHPGSAGFSRWACGGARALEGCGLWR